MMRNADDIPYGVDSRVERLISRRLDGELTREEDAELDHILLHDSNARALMEDYAQADGWAAAALRADVQTARTHGSASTHRNLWVCAAGAVITAAAVVALSFLLPDFNDAPDRTASGAASQVTPRPASMPAPSRFIDYSRPPHQPRRHVNNEERDIIGIRGRDPNVIYIFERKQQTRKASPALGDI